MITAPSSSWDTENEMIDRDRVDGAQSCCYAVLSAQSKGTVSYGEVGSWRVTPHRMRTRGYPENIAMNIERSNNSQYTSTLCDKRMGATMKVLSLTKIVAGIAS